jgi:hypothetical protein
MASASDSTHMTQHSQEKNAEKNPLHLLPCKQLILILQNFNFSGF